MKQMLYILMALVIVGSVSAVTSPNVVNVDCGSSSWWNPLGNYCEDNELQSEFNQVTDMIGDNTQDISDVQDSISLNDAKWSQDSSGTSMSSVRRFLFGDFVDFLKGLFVTRAEFESLEDKYYGLMADGDFNQAVLLEMEDKGLDKVQRGKYTCSISNNQLVCMG